ncbi:hypothetical protein ACIRVF_33705 [Kitasatospora sp. NPDC101157]|uniref:hypothetical protein n=1 Tax=Kitasatospora sp. NPDC101157 TaxID=3364098 RepID=UPI00380FB169
MDEDQHDERFPLVLYRHDGGELMMPAGHVTALLRHIAETFRLWRVRGQVRMDLETTARLYDALVRYAADLDAGIVDAHSPAADPATDRAQADELARYLAEVTGAYLAADEPSAG